MSFNGKYLIKIQAKSQVVLPAKLRDDDNSSEFPQSYYLMNEGFVGESPVSSEISSARIIMYPVKVWNEIIAKMEEKLRSEGKKEVGQQIKVLRASVEKVELDPQNRFTLKKELLDRAGIEDKEIYFVGSGSKIEIWDKSAFDQFTASYEESIRKTFKELSEDF
jgi:MraZ protein